MAIFLDCPSCRTKLKVGDEARGKLVRCSKCQTTTLIPNDDPISVETNVPSSDPPPLDYDNDARPRQRRQQSRDTYWDDDVRDDRFGRRPKRRRRAWPWVLGAVGILVVLIVVGMGLFGLSAGAGVGRAEDTAAKYFEAYRNKDWDGAMSLYSNAFFNATPREKWRQMLTSISEKLGDYQSRTKVSWKYFSNNRGSTATLTYQVQYSNGQATEVFTLQESGDQYLILGHNINSPAFLGGNK